VGDFLNLYYFKENRKIKTSQRQQLLFAEHQLKMNSKEE
jgi:hypothetical protein